MSGADAGLARRTILASDDILALVELLDGEREAVQAQCDHTFDPDPDDRPIPLQVPRFWAGLMHLETGELLGTMSWRPVPHLVALSGIGWNQGFHLLPAARGRGLSARGGLLLARYLFATTEVDRIQAMTDAENVPARRGMESAGFRLEGVLRGIVRRGGESRDLLVYSLLRSDLETADGEREVLARRDGVVLARARPDDHRAVAAVSDGAFALDQDGRLSPEAPRQPFRGAVLDAETGRLLGVVSWHAVGYGGTFGCAAWNIGIEVVPDARGQGVGTTAQRLLAEHLFATTGLDRVEAGMDVDNVAERRALEKAGFQRDGVIRGALLRGGRRRDLVLYGILRTDLDDSKPVPGPRQPQANA
ncbi:MAG TPA: GNAT family protein [Actinophytocola sp.]|uniref:GNAT family N-acetyltransferase n=1 Tax=Actinophytocola sp. TaxID=1872138 RepID=UPI002DDCD5DD|nr:GNAT family protein [Actinophytocola sp.]HEV2782728.1 GNAT family protein [Actinophytocola sp.]